MNASFFLVVPRGLHSRARDAQRRWREASNGCTARARPVAGRTPRLARAAGRWRTTVRSASTVGETDRPREEAPRAGFGSADRPRRARRREHFQYVFRVVRGGRVADGLVLRGKRARWEPVRPETGETLGCRGCRRSRRPETVCARGRLDAHVAQGGDRAGQDRGGDVRGSAARVAEEAGWHPQGRDGDADGRRGVGRAVDPAAQLSFQASLQTELRAQELRETQMRVKELASDKKRLVEDLEEATRARVGAGRGGGRALARRRRRTTTTCRTTR